MRASLDSYLEDFLKRGDETAFAERRGLRVERRSYRRVAETACRFARELDARGVVKGERVLVWAANSSAWVSAFFGCLLRGVIVVPLDVESAPADEGEAAAPQLRDETERRRTRRSLPHA